MSLRKLILCLLSLPAIIHAGGFQALPITKNNAAISSNSSVVFKPFSYVNLDIARGLFPRRASIHKFGDAGDVDTADGFVDLWDGGAFDTTIKTYTFSSTADIDSLSSSSASDTEPIQILGLDTNFELVLQTITLTGQTRVALTTSLIRIIGMKNDGSNVLVGNVFCFVNGALTAGVPDTLTDIRAIILIGNGRSLMAILTVPENSKAYWLDFWASLSKKQASISRIRIRTREFGKVFLIRHFNTITSTGTSKEHQPFKVPVELEARTDFVMSADTDTNNTGVSGGADFIFIGDNVSDISAFVNF